MQHFCAEFGTSCLAETFGIQLSQSPAANCYEMMRIALACLMVSVSAQDIFLAASQKTNNTKNLAVGNHEWDCNCPGTFDVCNPSTCYYSQNCGYADGVENKQKTMQASSAPPSKVGDHAWHCNCQGDYAYCSFTTCYASCTR